MQFKHFCMLGLCTNSIFFLTSQVASAFSFTLPSPTPLPCEPGVSFYCAEHKLVLPGADGGVVTTKLKPITNLTLGGTNSFFELLKNSVWTKNGWQFQPATTNLSGKFDIGVYNAYATLQSVGANIQIPYQPGENDPTGSNVHWIQRVVNNHATARTLSGTKDLGHGTSENSIDVLQEQTDPLFSDTNNPQKQTFNPFYDTYSKLANQTLFEDFPARPDIFENHDWYAELYLVEVKDLEDKPSEIKEPEKSEIKEPEKKNKPKEVIVYNGISWGWENTFTPQPTKTFSGTLTGGSQTDKFTLDKLTPGSYFYTWTNNNILSNRCNPNTYLYATSGTGYNYDDDSSPVGDGFASALSGIVPDNGIIDLFVRAANGGRRGEDFGNYELNVKVYDEAAPPSIIIGSSGGGRVSRPPIRMKLC